MHIKAKTMTPATFHLSVPTHLLFGLVPAALSALLVVLSMPVPFKNLDREQNNLAIAGFENF